MPHRFLSFSLVLFLLLGKTTATPVTPQAKPDGSSLESARVALEKTVRAAITQSGGDPEKQQIHLVVALKTGYFSEDPLRATAARDLVTNFAADFLVPGDVLTARAFEFGLWSHKDPAQLTLNLEDKTAHDATTRKALFSSLWPITPKAGSVGGHDTERTLVELTREFSTETNVVLVLISNFAASQGTAGESLLGSNAPDYQSVLEQWSRIEGTQEGATLELPINMILPQNTTSAVSLAAIVMVPKTFSGTMFTQGTRTTLLGVETALQPAASGGSSLPIFIGLGVLLLGGIVFFLLKNNKGTGGSRGKRVLEVQGQRFELSSITQGKGIVVLAGKGYTNDSSEAVVEFDKVPSGMRLARLVKTARGVKVEHSQGDLELKDIDGDLPSDPIILRDIGEYALNFEGRVQGETGVPRLVRIGVVVSIGEDL